MSRVTSFRINTYRRPVSVDSKTLTGALNPLDATLTRNRGEGRRLWLTRFLLERGDLLALSLEGPPLFLLLPPKYHRL